MDLNLQSYYSYIEAGSCYFISYHERKDSAPLNFSLDYGLEKASPVVSTACGLNPCAVADVMTLL